jgi:hypothetical protein
VVVTSHILVCHADIAGPDLDTSEAGSCPVSRNTSTIPLSAPVGSNPAPQSPILRVMNRARAFSDNKVQHLGKMALKWSVSLQEGNQTESLLLVSSPQLYHRLGTTVQIIGEERSGSSACSQCQ